MHIFIIINDDAKKRRYLSVTNNFIFSHNYSFNLHSQEVLYKSALPWTH